MHRSCLRCDRSLGANDELPNLAVGRRIAFDSNRGRVWVVCPHCQQWNLVPLDRRWEVLEDCERVAATAESRVDGHGIGIARTERGLTLLLATGVPESDIANSRYGHRLEGRLRLVKWTAAALVLLTIAIGVRVAFEGGAPIAGVFAGGFVAFSFWHLWNHPPRPWVRVPSGTAAPRIIPGHRLNEIRFDGNLKTAPALVIPRWKSQVRLAGVDAARFLAALLPKVNGVECAGASIEVALKKVAAAERGTHQPAHQRKRSRRETAVEASQKSSARPWERLARQTAGRPLLELAPDVRLALEMAVTEEMEQRTLAGDAVESGKQWADEEEIGAIADDLLVPDEVRARLGELTERKKKRRKG